MRKTLLLAFVFLASFTVFAQNYSNKGKDFWIAYPEHVNGTNSIMGLYITSDVNTAGTISVNGTNIPFTVTANTIVPRFLNSTGTGTFVIGSNTYVHLGGLQDGIKPNAAIHVVSDSPVVVYAHIIFSARSGSSLILPTSVWGKEYIVPSHANASGGNTGNQGYGEFVVMASLPNTLVEITPQITSRNGVRTAGVPYQITLANPGDVYQLQFPQGADMSGTLIKSIASGTSGCQPIAVVSGTTWTALNCASVSGGDNLYQQLFPYGSWGKEFFTTPLKKTASATDHNVDVVRVYVKDPTTVVQKTENAVTTTLTGLSLANYYEYSTEFPTNILADKPIQVMQYVKTQGCNAAGSPATQSDPEMIALSSVEQTINDITVYSSIQANVPGGNSNVTTHYINVVMKSANIGSFTINGAPPGNAFTPIPGTAYSYLKQGILTSAPVSRLKADSGFSAIAYGFGNVESYGYNAGTSVRDLNTRLEVNNPNSSPTETEPSACTNSPFRFKVYFPDSAGIQQVRYDSIKWEVLNNAFNFVPNNFPIMVTPTLPDLVVQPDSTNYRNGKPVAWYSLPSLYQVIAPGVYPIRITLYRSSSEGCGNSIEYPFDLTVTDPPTASYNTVLPGCYLDSVRVTETTPQSPKTTYKQWWEFYDPVANLTTVYSNMGINAPAIRYQAHLFTTTGPKRIRHVSITTPGCISDTIVQNITLPDRPDATIAGNTAVCLNSVPSVPVTFTGTLGTAEYVFTYNINGGAPIVSAPSAGGTLTIPAPTNVAGTFVYNLVGVANASPAGTPCTRAITGQSITVQINPLPVAAITGATTVCLNGTPPPVTFTGSGGTAPYTFNYTINGNPQAPVVSNAAGVYTLNAPTNVAGPFNYTITQVTDASSTLCSSTPNVSTLITVQDLPNAAIASSTTAVCQNAPQPTITFTGSGGTAPYTFNYTINSVAQTPVISNAAGVATLNVPTTTVGPYVYEITQVTEGSPQACVRAITGQTSTINVNPLPNAAIAGAVTVCLNSAPDPIVTFTGSNATAPYTFDYTINGIPQVPVVSNAAGIATVNAPTTVVGSFIYAVTQVTDGSTTACVRPITGTSTTITIQDLPNGVIAGSATSACLNSAPSPTITFTGSNGTAPYTFTYTINGTTQPTVVSNAAGVATINVPTNIATTYTYELTIVSEASAQLCSRNIAGQTFVVVINPLPTASVAGATAVCRNAPQPTVTFTGSGATAPYTFEYTINGTPQTPLVSNAAGIATVLAPTTVAGTFTYQLTRVTDASSTLCSQLQNGSTVITINQLPVAAFNTVGPRCANSNVVFNNTSTPNAAGTTTWAWDFGDPGSGASNTSAAQNPTHVFFNPNTAPGYSVTLTVTNSNGCISDPVASIIVAVNDTPRAGFIVPEVCINDVATVFTDTSSINTGANNTINAWYWEYGDPPSGPLNTSNGQHGSHLYPMPAIYQVTHAAINMITGCTDTIVQPITINSADPVSNFTVANSCSIDSVSLTNLSSVGFGNVTRLEIYWDNVGAPGTFETINVPVFNAVYKHKYPTSTTTQTYTVRMIAYSGNICFTQTTRPVTVYATPVVQFNNIPNTCYLVAPFQLTQGSEIGGVPGTGTYSGLGITNPNGTFNPQVAGIGTHTIRYTWTASNPGACIDTLDRTITVLDTAHAKFAVTLPSCEQTPTLFTNTSTAPASVSLVSTVWDFGDGTGLQTFPIANPISHIYANANAGPFTVTMHTVDNNLPTGCISTDTMAVINIDANHHIQLISGSENQPLCVNTSIVPIQYTLSGGASNVTFIPSLPPGLTYVVGGSPLSVTISGSPTVPNNYSFDIETAGNTCVKDRRTITISVAPDHAIALRAGSDTAQSICLNTPIDDIYYDLSGGATGVNITGLPTGVTYTVTGNELRIYGTPTSIPALPGYTITTTGNTCLWATKIGEIVVHPYPVPSFTVDKSGYCIPNANVQFTNTTTPAPVTSHTYVWDFGDGSPTVPFLNPTHWYTSGVGPFTVRLSATSVVTPILNNGQPGCNAFIDVPMTTIHPQPKADFVFNKPSVCIGDNVTITDNTDGRDGIVNQWSWDLGDGTTRTVNPVTHTYGDTITYNVTFYAVNTHGCNSDTITKPFTVYPYPHVSAGPDKFVLEGGSVELESTSFANDPLYTWTPDLYLTDARVARPRVVNPKTDMTYRLTITGRGGCAISDDVFVKLLKFPVIPNTFTPNNDGINDTWRIDFLHTYPENRVQIFTRTGKLVFESRGYNTPWDGTIKGKPLPFDTYYYIIEPGNGRDPITGYVTIIK